MEERVPAFPDVDALDDEALKQLCRDLHGELFNELGTEGINPFGFKLCAIERTRTCMTWRPSTKNHLKKLKN